MGGAKGRSSNAPTTKLSKLTPWLFEPLGKQACLQSMFDLDKILGAPQPCSAFWKTGAWSTIDRALSQNWITTAGCRRGSGEAETVGWQGELHILPLDMLNIFILSLF